MLIAGEYPICVSELPTYAHDAIQLFAPAENACVREFLAFHPEGGDMIAGTGGIRVLHWPIKKRKSVPNVRIIYYFRDLNMPLVLLAIYRAGERVALDGTWRAELKALVDELVAQYSKGWLRLFDRGS